jgi:hypothetical protein
MADDIDELRAKAAAFDLLTRALTNRWSDGKWSWWCRTPCGSTETLRETREEAIADLMEWAARPKNQREPINPGVSADNR